jgi:hypothetical protein
MDDAPAGRLKSVAIAVNLLGDVDRSPIAATVIDRLTAVTTALVPAGDLVLTFADKQTRGGSLVGRIASGVTVIRIDEEVIPPEIGPLEQEGRFTTIWPGSNGPRVPRIFASPAGLCASFAQPPEYPAALVGTPLFSGDRLVAVFDKFNPSVGGWLLVPAMTILADVLRPVSTDQLSTPPNDQARGTSIDVPSLFIHFDLSARRAMMHAFAVAGEREIHIEHLVLGLYENPEGSTRRILNARNVSEELLRDRLTNATKQKFFSPEEYQATPLTEMPPLSDHTRQAVEIAARTAMSQGERDIRTRHLLFGVLSVDKCKIRDVLESLRVLAADVQMKDAPRISGYISDVADGHDLLGVQREARALAAVLGASKVEPPIAVGLLGTWGSGKSFFMRQLQQELTAVEDRGGKGDGDCCSSIVQIWFNAWHYIDSNLWASLTSEIFDALDAELTRRADPASPPVDPAVAKARLLAESAKAQSEKEKASTERAAADAEIARIAETRTVLASDEHLAARVGLLTIATAAADLAAQNPQVQQVVIAAKNEADAFAKKFGVDRATVATLQGLRGRVRALYLAVRSKGPQTWRVLLLLTLVSVALIVGATRFSDQWETIFRYLGSAGVVATLTAFGNIARKYGPDTDRLIKAIEPFFRAKDQLIAAERQKALADLERRKAAAEAQHAQALAREEAAAKRLHDIERQLLEQQPTYQMKSFVRERRESTDYTQHLGVIARAHDDFDRLSRYLKTTTCPDGSGGTKRLVDRIVLYIDDLDRCPEAKVVDVLQAVHLLLAFPLFVVVVGVDSRWLLHSLKMGMTQFSAKRDDRMDAVDRSLWESTPMNYLEKIFQIPFTLRAMPETGFDVLIDDLTRRVDTRPARLDQPAVQASAGAASTLTASSSALDTPALTGSSQSATSSATSAPGVSAGLMSTASMQPVVASPQTQHLAFTEDEVRYMKALYPLMPSPRAVKRFVNLYRLMRGLLDDYRFAGYVDDQKREYEAALLLLAMLIGFPEETTVVLKELTAESEAKLWWTFITTMIKDRKDQEKSAPAALGRWVVLEKKLASIRTEAKKPAETRTCEHFVTWASEVARFSFHSGTILTDYRSPTPTTSFVQGQADLSPEAMRTQLHATSMSTPKG